MNNRKQLKLWMHIGVWLLAFFIHTLVFSRFYSLPLSLLRGLLNVAPMALLFYANIWLVNRYFDKKSYWRFALYSGALVLLLTFFGCALICRFLT
ncbi:MAG: hypothetical protein IPN33_12130 [Saprospiraceae bacterium]|nr:hypothetical protein [Saprospiraceae bacterium]